MTIHVNIGEAKTRFSELCAAALRGEEVIVQNAGVPKLKLVPIDVADRIEREHIARRRVAAIGMFKTAFEGFDLSLEALEEDRGDPDERVRRKFGSDT
jgi:prevent-host-death family protein